MVPNPRIQPGTPAPLGATWDGRGANFALFSAHAEKVELCLFDATGQRELERIELPEFSNGIWHGYLRDARPGLLYGYRVYGPYDPSNGHRFNPHKLLIDPYAKLLHGKLSWSDAHFGYRIGSPKEDFTFDRRDSARGMPKSVLIDPAFTWGADKHPETRRSDTIVYEMHVRGLQMNNERIPVSVRGSFAGLGSRPIVDHLVNLGVTALELLPVHAFVDDRPLVQRGLVNYWGYNSIAFFAPDQRYLMSGLVDEFKTFVGTMHEAGIEVLLDVVYNHTAEGNHMGPTLSFKGIDNASYYCLRPENRRYYEDYTGCGNSLNTTHPRVMQMVLDSLRHWVSDMHVDGFRFDLATTLGRLPTGYDPNCAFLQAIGQDPVLARSKLIAEPWDIGLGGYQVGNFPPGWSEWNDRYRDIVRRFWRGDPGTVGELASRLTGSSDIFHRQGRRPIASVNFVTAHDGFTLNDLVTFNDKHNLENGEDNRDGINNNNSWNCGVEGPTNDAAINELRHRQMRNMMATLMLSHGMPMILAGDEMGNGQCGNNNTYCQDNMTGWTDWPGSGHEDEEIDPGSMLAFTRRLIALRKRFPGLRRRLFATGTSHADGELRDVTWLNTAGKEMMFENWTSPESHCFGALLNADAKEGSEALLIVMNSFHYDTVFELPNGLYPGKWECLLDTARDTGCTDTALVKTVTVMGRSLQLLHGTRAARS